MYESRHHKILPIHRFVYRVCTHLAIGVGIIFIFLGIGIFGYHYFEDMDWITAYENAAMILSGMGPVDPIYTDGGKIFAGTYALFSGVIFLVVIAIIIAPLFHRFFHKFMIKDIQ
jgi:hypothetical protein